MLARIDAVPAPRETTAAAHLSCVEHVILNVREDPAHTFSLSEMAGIACMSRFHFNRVFRRVTGVPPRVFQLMLRVETAKRMLLTTGMTITEVCFATGYSSVGTFTRRFAEIVGVPPSTFRRHGERAYRPGARGEGASASIVGTVLVPAPFTGRVVVGAFTSPIPYGAPAGCCTIGADGGAFRIDGLPRRRYYVAAAAIPDAADRPESALRDDVLRARCGPVAAFGALAELEDPLVLRPRSLTDAPILIPLGRAG